MVEISMDATSAIRGPNDSPAPSFAGGAPASDEPTFGEHLSRAQQSHSKDNPRDASQPAARQRESSDGDGSNPPDKMAKAASSQPETKNSGDADRDVQSHKDAKGASDSKDAKPADATAGSANQTAAVASPAGAPAATTAAAQAAAAETALKTAAAQATPLEGQANTAVHTDKSGGKDGAIPTGIKQVAAGSAATGQAKAQAALANQAAIDSQRIAAAAAPAVKTASETKSQPTAPSEKAQAAASTAQAPGLPGPQPNPAANAAKAERAALAAQTLLAAAKAQASAASSAAAQTNPSAKGDDAQQAAAAAANAANLAAAQLVAAPATHAGVEKSGAESVHKAAADQAASQPLSPNASPGTLAPSAGAPPSLGVNPSGLVAGAAGRADAANGHSAETSAADADRMRFVQRVARAFQAAGDNGGQVKLRLSPPELGSLQLNITVKDGAMTAHVQAETANAQNLLLNSLPDLRDRLAQQDIRLERFDVDLTNQSPGGMPQTPNQHQNPNDAPRRPAPTRNASAAIEAAPPIVANSYLGGGGLNVVI